jgi:hypothetical protein
MSDRKLTEGRLKKLAALVGKHRFNPELLMDKISKETKK